MHAIKIQRNFRKNEKAASPAISTMILTAAVVVMILVASTYASDFLSKRIAENEYNANKQFMLTTGLQIDDTAWTVGRTQTIRYTTDHGSMSYQSSALSYSFEVHYTGTPEGNWDPVVLSENETGMLMFKLPVNMYTLGNNYFSRLSSSNGSIVKEGPSAPVTEVFCIEKLGMPDGSYIRIIAVPSIRMLTSTITGSEATTVHYYKFYLPLLNTAYSNPYLSDAVSLTGHSIDKVIISGVDKVRVNVTYPNIGQGYDETFYNFAFDDVPNSQTILLDPNSVVELYVGQVLTAIGAV